MSKIRLKWSRYIPHRPTIKQLAFLMLPHREALFGGMVGGGKSDALLMAALQYADVPGYSAIIFRKTLSDLKMPGALIDRSHAWLAGTGAQWSAGEHCWYFPTKNPDGSEGAPARLQFGYIGESAAYLRYQGIEVQYCAFDELTQHEERDYTYLFSRLRKNVCALHPERDDEGSPIYRDDCPFCQQQKNLPLRMRAATNPGGPGHNWVQKRFAIVPECDPREAKRLGVRVRYIGANPARPFIPSSILDNPYIDQKSYLRGLEELSPLDRDQLRYGDWGASPDARFKIEWARYYRRHGSFIELGGRTYDLGTLQKIFATVDPAASAREGPGDVDKGYKPSWTVISVWGVTPDYHLIWLDMVRFRKEIPDIVKKLKEVYAVWKPLYFVVDQTGVGRGVLQYAMRLGMPVKAVRCGSDKVVSSTEAQIRMEQGRIWLPQEAPWKEIVEGELFSWTGTPNEEDDIIDTLSYAAKEVSWQAVNDERFDPDNRSFMEGAWDVPSVISQNYPVLSYRF